MLFWIILNEFSVGSGEFWKKVADISCWYLSNLPKINICLESKAIQPDYL